MKTISIHQPAYLPWLGYFDKIIKSDIFVYLDNVQFEKNYFINRNKILTNRNEILWLTVPVLTKGHLQNKIKDINIDNRTNWKRKHLRTIELNYKKRPFFNEIFSELKELIEQADYNLSDFLYKMLMYFIKLLRINTKIVHCNTLEIIGTKNQLVINICKKFGATHYLSGILGKNYIDENLFLEENIELCYQDYKPKEYFQDNNEFIPNLSIIDALFNIGRNDTINLLKKNA